MNRSLLRPITPEELRTYEEDGVVWLRGIVDEQWPSQLAAAINDLIVSPRGQAVDFTNLGLAANAFSAEMSSFTPSGKWAEPEREWGSPRQLAGRVLEDEKVQPAPGRRGHFLSMTGTWQRHPVIRELALSSPLPEIAAILMRSRKVYLYDDQVLVKPPGTMEKTAWHQDMGYDNIQGEKVCGIRMPAGKETPEMGLVQYLRGSHKSGRIFKVNYFISNATSPDDGGEEIPAIEGHEADFDLVWFAPEPGDVVVHHLRTLHGAGGNCSPVSTRRGITVRYGGDDVTHKFRKHAPPQDLSDLRDGDALDKDSARHPVVWPR